MSSQTATNTVSAPANTAKAAATSSTLANSAAAAANSLSEEDVTLYNKALEEEKKRKEKEGSEIALAVTLVILVVVILVLVGLGYLNASSAAAIDAATYPSECHCTVGTLSYDDPTNANSAMTCSESDYDQTTIPPDSSTTLYNVGVSEAIGKWSLTDFTQVKQTLVDVLGNQFTLSGTIIFHNGSLDGTVKPTVLRVAWSNAFVITDNNTDPTSKATYYFQQTDDDGLPVYNTDGSPVTVPADLRFFVVPTAAGYGVKVSNLYQSSGANWQASQEAEIQASYAGMYTMQVPMPVYSATWKKDYMCAKAFAASFTLTNKGSSAMQYELRILKSNRMVPGQDYVSLTADGTTGEILTTFMYAGADASSARNVIAPATLAAGQSVILSTSISNPLQEGDGITLLVSSAADWRLNIAWYTSTDSEFGTSLGDLAFEVLGKMPTDATQANIDLINEMNQRCLYLGHFTSFPSTGGSMVSYPWVQQATWLLSNTDGPESTNSTLYTYASYSEAIDGIYQTAPAGQLHAIRFYAPTLAAYAAT